MLFGALILVTDVLRDSSDRHTALSLLLMESCSRTLQRLQREGYDIESFTKGYGLILQIAKSAVHAITCRIEDPEIEPHREDMIPKATMQRLAIRLLETSNPMLIVEGLMGNMPKPRARAASVFSDFCGGAVQEMPSFSPPSLRPMTYGFGRTPLQRSRSGR